ncbi:MULTISPECIES: NAD(P)-dependent oxidoreductase [unclassified Pseudomonas]|nr:MULTISPECIES: NAD(P)-dependent oxidoreductase [unclassified Pseudomonas]
MLNERSRNIVGRAELQRMKPHAWLINTARSGWLISKRC